ncbi:MAG: TDG/mug DNA glycosylase family protein [Oleiphilaceae bacterium]|jgi:hypoxanthine-DNA glycosylase
MTDSSIVIEDGFKPLLGLEPKVLILGTMPSVQSLKTQQYYGHPRNVFWWIMSELCCFDLSRSYSEKVGFVLKNKIAVWDVIASCHRPGSLDSNIDQGSITPNRLSELFEKYPSLKLIAFNGQAAEKLFSKFIDEQAWQGSKVVLPSTSPANAAMTKETKLFHWARIKTI